MDRHSVYLKIYLKVKDHLLTQNRKSQLRENQCVLYGPENTRCAVGCLINEEFYRLDLEEDSGVYSNGLTNPELLAALEDSGIDVTDKMSLRLLADLQFCHDCLPVDQWEDFLGSLRKTYFEHISDEVPAST